MCWPKGRAANRLPDDANTTQSCLIAWRHHAAVLERVEFGTVLNIEAMISGQIEKKTPFNCLKT